MEVMMKRMRPSIKGPNCTVTSREVPWSKKHKKNESLPKFKMKVLQIEKRERKKTQFKAEGKFRALRGAGGEEKKNAKLLVTETDQRCTTLYVIVFK
jgi:hypothetical protein